MAVKYTCPECSSVLRPANPVPPGKKIKCPECAAIFVPVPGSAAGAPAVKSSKDKNKSVPAAAVASAPAKKKSDDDDDDIDAAYGIATDPNAGVAEPKVHFGSLRDKYAKSKRGPAMAKVVKPANTIMFIAILFCIACLIMAVAAIFPIVFTEKALPSDRMNSQLLQLFLWVLGFCWGGLIIMGCSKMQSLESYNWAMAGSVMAVPLFFIGVMGIVALRDPSVIEGFEEEPPSPDK